MKHILIGMILWPLFYLGAVAFTANAPTSRIADVVRITDIPDTFLQTTPRKICWTINLNSIKSPAEINMFLDKLEPWQSVHAKLVYMPVISEIMIFYPVRCGK